MFRGLITIDKYLFTTSKFRIYIEKYLFSRSPSKFKVQLWFNLQKCLEGQSPLMSICSQLHIQLWFILQSLEFTLTSISSASYLKTSHTIMVYPSKLMSISSTTHQDESELTIKVYSSKVFRGSIVQPIYFKHNIQCRFSFYPF